MLLEVGDFTAHPDHRERAFDDFLRRLREIGDRHHLGRIRRSVAAPPAVVCQVRGRIPRARHLLCISAARTVFSISMAIVILPTPPGTGVIFDATCFTPSKSTSPTS